MKKKFYKAKKEAMFKVIFCDPKNKDLLERLLFEATGEEMEALRKTHLSEAYNNGISDGIKQGIEQGIEQGIKHGIGQNSLKIAKEMLNKNIDTKLISEITGLSIDQITNS